MPGSSAVASSTSAKPFCFNAYVTRWKRGKREAWQVERQRQQERQKGSSGASENEANRDGERC